MPSSLSRMQASKLIRNYYLQKAGNAPFPKTFEGDATLRATHKRCGEGGDQTHTVVGGRRKKNNQKGGQSQYGTRQGLMDLLLNEKVNHPAGMIKIAESGAKETAHKGGAKTPKTKKTKKPKKKKSAKKTKKKKSAKKPKKPVKKKKTPKKKKKIS